MTKPIDQALDTLYEQVMEMPNKVLDIFNNFFGEYRVDMQGFPSRKGLRRHVLELAVYDIFTRASMEDKLPIMGDHTDEKLIDVIDSLPVESTAAIVEALLSTPFIKDYKNINGFILVHFPRTVVTNEHNRSTMVNHIYIKVPITANGAENGLFTMNRSEYTVAELYSNYMHSHASSIPRDHFENFVFCCLGEGPLSHTQSILSTGFDEDGWYMFCLELSKYVEVESIAGHPYHYLEQISFNDFKVNNIDKLANKSALYAVFLGANRNLIKNTIKEFFSYYLEHNNLTFSYRNGVYSIGMSFVEYLIHLSNSFIEYVNNRPELVNSGIIDYGIINNYRVKNGEIYQTSSDMSSYISTYRRYVGERVCTFKGNPVTITITDLDHIVNNEKNTTRLINISLASWFLNKILTTLNYRYGRNQEDPNTIAGRVRYEV